MVVLYSDNADDHIFQKIQTDLPPPLLDLENQPFVRVLEVVLYQLFKANKPLYIYSLGYSHLSTISRAVSNDHLQWNDCNDRNEMIHCHFIAPSRSLQWSLDFSVRAQSFHCHCHCKWWFHICSLHHCISLHTFATDSLSFHWKLGGLTHIIISLHAYYAAICNEHITFIVTSQFHIVHLS